MPGRHVRKILRQKEERHQVADSEEDTASETESSNSHPPPPSNNFFHALNNLHEQVDEVDYIEETLDDTDSNELSWSKEDIRPQNNKKKKKKKKKDSLFLDEMGKGIDMDIEKLSLCDISSTEQLNPHVNKKGNQDRAILWIDPKYLNATKELQKMFGAKVVKFVESERASSSKSRHGRRPDRYVHKKTFLVSTCDHWPRLTGLLSMELIETKQGYNYFRYVHPFSYNEAQREFEAAKDSHVLDNIASVLRSNPYHVDSLLTMAEYFRFTGEHDMASDTVSKCLYALECAWHPMFTPFRSNSLLEFTHETNRPLFSTLFTHMKSLSKRGCHRSALEVCKLILSLDHADPMGTLLCIDYYSLRAHEYSWFERFATEYENTTYLFLFPNFVFSLAVCRFYIESRDAIKAGSMDMMKRALLVHPTVVGRLVRRVPMKEEAWGNIVGSGFFRQEWTGNRTVDHLVDIYIERSHGVWRLPELQKLLMEGAFLVMEELETSKNDAKNWARVKEEAFSSEENEYGHLQVSNFSDKEPTMAPENLQNLRGERGGRNGGGRGEEGERDGVRRYSLGQELVTSIFETLFPFSLVTRRGDVSGQDTTE